MVKNRMEDVAKLLNLELEEEFKIEGLLGNYKLSKEGLKSWSKGTYDWLPSSLLEELITGHAQIIKVSKPTLNEKEKEYLSAVIKPFRDRVIYITKLEDGQDEYIGIVSQYYGSETDSEEFVLPSFKRETMYKGMQAGKDYTVEELEL